MFDDIVAETPTENPGSYPTEGVTVAINHHPSTQGKHRIRFYFPREVAETLRRGLSWPHLHIDGTTVNGLRVWCGEEGGYAPTLAKAGSWTVTMPARRMRAREEVVGSIPVGVAWERDKTGPVLLIPRLPDALLPQDVIDKLPNSAVDQETRHDRAEKRLKQEMRRALGAGIDDGVSFENPSVPLTPEQIAEPPAAEAPPMDPAPVDPPSPPAADLKTALAMVNELVDQLGDTVVLSIDASSGHVTAKRRVVQFIDL